MVLAKFPLAALISLALATVFTPMGAHGAQGINPVDIKEWPVPFGGGPRDPYASNDNAIWFVGQAAHYLARLSPSNGTFFKRDLPDSAGPHNLIVGNDGIVWYSGNRAGYIGRYDPQADSIEKIGMPDSSAYDPHTLVFDHAQQHIWFTVQGGNFVGRLNLANRHVDLIEVATPGARPYGIRMADDGTPWIALLGTNKLAAVEPATLKLTEIEIPARDARPRRIETTRDGRIWYADYRRGVLGSYNPATQTFAEWALPSGEDSRPYGMASDNEHRIWLVETGVRPNQFVAFDTRAGKVTSVTPIPSGAGSVRHMNYHKPSGVVWFGTDRATIGRAIVGNN
jgi:virginiamycin B lyase